MSKIFSSENLIGFGVSVLAGVAAIYIVFRLLPANIKTTITG